ncbi:MAG: hypothetical protein SAJ72_01610 [Jaaginema sp. PMC 1080.18]|nr:hypothetical protein [Jaaginema sp. PMC 1080.18]MEC4866562.1 hypothetical protein [Jaaginema sp. PMC 1078.18]
MKLWQTVATTAAIATSTIAIAPTVEAITLTTYTNQSAWESAVGSFETEAFEDNIFEDFSVTSESTSSDYPGEASGGLWKDRVGPTLTTVWTFTEALTAWGGEGWNLAGPGGSGTGIKVTLGLVDGTEYTLGEELLRSWNDNFFGFLSDTAFNTVTLTGGTQSGVFETYTLDDMVYAEAQQSVPEPTAILSLLAIAALGASPILKTKNS